MIRRGLRLELVAGLGIALAMPAAAFAAQATATQTTLSVETHDQAARTKASVSVSVIGGNSLPATGVIALSDHGRPLAGAVLNAQGQATFAVDLAAGAHSLTANYAGDTS